MFYGLFALVPVFRLRNICIVAWRLFWLYYLYNIYGQIGCSGGHFSHRAEQMTIRYRFNEEVILFYCFCVCAKGECKRCVAFVMCCWWSSGRQFFNLLISLKLLTFCYQKIVCLFCDSIRILLKCEIFIFRKLSSRIYWFDGEFYCVFYYFIKKIDHLNGIQINRTTPIRNQSIH